MYNAVLHSPKGYKTIQTEDNMVTVRLQGPGKLVLKFDAERELSAKEMIDMVLDLLEVLDDLHRD